MYRHILLPTDGSELSRKAVENAVLFAENIGARITGVHVIPGAAGNELGDWAHHDATHRQRQLELRLRQADDYLSWLANSAQAEGVPCECKILTADQPHAAILEEAGRSHCDLIFMASHAASDEAEAVLDSESLKVLRHSPIPVLVFRTPAVVC